MPTSQCRRSRWVAGSGARGELGEPGATLGANMSHHRPHALVAGRAKWVTKRGAIVIRALPGAAAGGMGTRTETADQLVEVEGLADDRVPADAVTACTSSVVER